MAYAKKTKVNVEKSQGEVRKILSKYGATAMAIAENQSLAQITFEIKGYRVRFNLPLPKPPSANATAASVKTYNQLCKSKWRSLVLAIKAKLECVESGITSIEQEFLAHIVLSDGRTTGEFFIPQIAESYALKQMPPMLDYSSK